MSEINSFLSADAQKEVQKYIADLELIASRYKDIAVASLQLEKAKQAEAKTEQELLKTKQQAEVLAQKKLKTQKDEQQASERLAKAVKKETSEWEKLNKAHKDALQKARDLGSQYGRNSRQFKDASKEANNLNNKMQGLNKELGGANPKGVGKYFEAIMKGAGALGLIATGAQLAKGAINLLGSFFTATEKGAELAERKMAGFSAAVGVLRGEFAKLGEQITGDKADSPTKWGSIMAGSLQVVVNTLLPGLKINMNETALAMNDAAEAAEKYTRKLQELQDFERSLIVTRAESNRNLVKAKAFAADEENSMADRIAMLKEANRFEEEATAAEIDAQRVKIGLIEEVNAEKKKAGLLRDEDLLKLEQAKAKEIDLETEHEQRIKRNTKALQKLNEEYALSKRISLKNIENEHYKSEQAITAFVKDETKKRLGDGVVNPTELTEGLKNRNKIQMDAYKEDVENFKDADREKQAIIQQSLEMSTQMVDALFNFQQVRLSAEMDSIERYYETRINAASNAGEDTAALEREYEIKRAEMDIKIAKSRRNQALFDIAMSTALGVMNATAQSPLTFGMPWSAFILTLGGIQASAVLAQPLPELPAFATGTMDSPSTFIAGEKGREIGITKDGRAFITPNKATLYSYMPGTKIIPNELSELVLKDIGTNVLDRKLDKVIMAIEKNSPSIFIDKSLSRSINLKHIRSKHGRN